MCFSCQSFVVKPLFVPSTKASVVTCNGLIRVKRAFSHDVRAAILVFQNHETAAMLVYQENHLGVELFSHVNDFFCSNKLA